METRTTNRETRNGEGDYPDYPFADHWLDGGGCGCIMWMRAKDAAGSDVAWESDVVVLLSAAGAGIARGASG